MKKFRGVNQRPHHAVALLDQNPTAKQTAMPDITIHVHSNDGDEPRPLTIAEEATIEDLLRMISPEGHAELFIVVEEESEPRERHHKLHECGIRDGHHVHCHPREIHYTVDKEPQKTRHH